MNMRILGRSISRSDILKGGEELEIVESYPDDKYLPSYLALVNLIPSPIHVLFAIDVEEDNVRVVTAYHPNPSDWEADLKTRRRMP
ncbi:MAG: DUF4258 domain-containing protein [Polyangia bacterium]|nr:DUF4258 domain-containing protein [Polyangia bacterium]